MIGIMLAILTPEQISKLLGSESGWYGVLIAAAIGSITLIPGFVAFPLAAALLKSGAGYMQIAAFVSTLMMVGIVTIPMEMKTFGKRVTIMREYGFVDGTDFYSFLSESIGGRPAVEHKLSIV